MVINESSFSATVESEALPENMLSLVSDMNAVFEKEFGQKNIFIS